jgi:thiamine biosynthesis lipoprotein
MKQIRLIMGMPITVKIAQNEERKTKKDLEKVFDYFRYVDSQYSPFKEDSQVAKLNRGEEVSREMMQILRLAEDLKKETDGYFDIRTPVGVKKPDGKIDPSGIVKGWAIKNAADILRKLGYKRFYVDAGGDAEIVGKNWKWGIRNPFNVQQIVKVLNLSDCGIATSGTYERGQHIYDPVGKKDAITDIVSMTVIGTDVYEADKFATPAFAMGKKGIEFIEKREGLEGYMIDSKGIAIMTSGFSKYVKQ